MKDEEMVKWVHRSEDNYVFVLKDALPKNILDMMEQVLLAYLPIPSFIDGTNIDKNTRDSEVRFMQYNESNTYVRNWLMNVANEYSSYFPNTDEFGKTINSRKGSLLPEPVQVTTYKQNNFYNWHIDGSAQDPRHMTLMAQLSKSDEYEGGNFEIEDLTLPSFVREKGTVILMKPHLKHRVTPVLKGERNSMITWFQTTNKT